MNSKYSVIFLGAGAPTRGGVLPALQNVNRNTKIIDWLLIAYENIDVSNYVFIAGYDYTEILNRYPEISFRLNLDWKEQGSLGSLFASPLPDTEPVFVSYTDILYRPWLIDKMNSNTADVVVAVDSNWRNRYADRKNNDVQKAEKILVGPEGRLLSASSKLSVNESNGEFAGILKLSVNAIAHLKAKLGQKKTKYIKESIPFLIQTFVEDGWDVQVIDTKGDFAELNAPEDISQFVLGTKAETLSRLRPMVKHSIIGDQFSFTVKEWQKDPVYIISAIQKAYAQGTVVVRSSAYTEDGWSSSNAGNFASILNVPSNNKKTIEESINTVIESYADDDTGHQVLVQKMLEDVAMSGVVFTRELTSGAPYYMLNYDALSGSTETVTSGASSNLETVTVSKNAWFDLRKKMPHLYPVIQAVREIEDLLNHDALDIEFAVTGEGKIYIFQVRPIAVDHSKAAINDSEVQRAINRAKSLFADLQARSPQIYGDQAIFGVMPDWNPAEIIGTRPKPLAASLYRYLIMDSTWARQRAEFGYKNIVPHPLMVMFSGHSYVDIRASFNSFIPSGVSDELSEKLVNSYLKRLEELPEFHDKVEFNIVFTCITFDFWEKANEILPQDSFSQDEVECLRQALVEVTKNGIGRIDKDLSSVEILNKKYSALLESDLPHLLKCRHMLDDCIEYGTLPFAHLARNGFIAIALLKSLEATGVLSRQDVEGFLSTVPSITGEFEADGTKVFEGKISWENFVTKYGHLRPGTYDICSPRYDSDPQIFLRPMLKHTSRHTSLSEKSIMSQPEKVDKIGSALERSGLGIDVTGFFDFCIKAISGRELAKFHFSRNLSMALELICCYVEEHGFSRKEAAFLDIYDLFYLAKSSVIQSPKKYIEAKINLNMKEYASTTRIQLPSLLLNADSFSIFSQLKSLPNYITTKKVVAEVVTFTAEGLDPTAIRGKIVMIESADPGFDWIFGYEIKGLITMYGGANSHMAIRSAELSIPAIIGAGSSLFRALSGQRLLELDCHNKTVRSLA